MKRKLINALGGLAVIVGLAGTTSEAQDTLRHSQDRNFQEFYDEGRNELPEGTYCTGAVFKAGAWSVHPLKRTVQEACYISRDVWEKIECNGRTFYERRTIVEPQLREREEIVGYDLHCDKEDALWYKGYEEAKRFKEKSCKELKEFHGGIKRHGRILKEDLCDIGHDIKRGGCKVIEGVGDVLSVPFYIGGAILGEIGGGLDKLGEYPHKHYPHPIPGDLNPYIAPVPWTTHPEYKPKVCEPEAGFYPKPTFKSQ